jgi:hypothetical protein
MIFFTALMQSKEIMDGNNIILVNWDKLANAAKEEFRVFTFALAAPNGEIVAKKTADFIKVAVTAGIVQKLDRIHLIGFGLGSQVGKQTYYKGYKKPKDVIFSKVVMNVI